MKFDGSQQVGGVGGTEEASIIKGISFKFPGAELSNQTVWAMPLENLSVANGREMAGIIGYEFFSHFVVEIDYTNGVINLYEPQNYKYRGGGDSIPLSIENGEIYVNARVSVPGRETFEGQFVIDTGGSTLLLTRSFVEENKLLESVGPTMPARGGGIGGEIQMAIGRVKNIQIGRFTIDSPVTGFIKTGEIAEPGKTGNFGARLLTRFRVIFDYSRKQMILESTARLTEPDVIDMSGVALMSEPPVFAVIKVARIRPGSAGADAGLQVNDIIMAIDGQPASSLSKLRKVFRVEGREYQLTVKRGEQTLQLKLKMKRLI